MVKALDLSCNGRMSAWVRSPTPDRHGVLFYSLLSKIIEEKLYSNVKNFF